MHACNHTRYLHPIFLFAQVEGIHLVLFGGIALFHVLNGAHVLEEQHVMEALCMCVCEEQLVMEALCTGQP